MVRKRLLRIGLILLAVVGLLLAAAAVGPDLLIVVAFGGLVWLLGEFALLLKGLWIAAGRAAFTRCELKVLQSRARLGETIEVEVSLAPKRPLTVSGAKLTLIAHEYAYRRKSGRNSSGTKFEDERVRATEVLDVPQAFVAPFSRVVRIQVPMDHPPTFRGKDDRLYTTVRLDLAIAGRPDIWLNGDVLVLPEVAA